MPQAASARSGTALALHNSSPALGESVTSPLPQSRGLDCFLSCENKAAKHTKDSSPHDSREKLGKKRTLVFQSERKRKPEHLYQFWGFF